MEHGDQGGGAADEGLGHAYVASVKDVDRVEVGVRLGIRGIFTCGIVTGGGTVREEPAVTIATVVMLVIGIVWSSRGVQVVPINVAENRGCEARVCGVV